MGLSPRTVPVRTRRRNAITARGLIQAFVKTAIAIVVLSCVLPLALTLGTWHAIQVVVLLSLLVVLCILVTRLAAPLFQEDDR